MSAISFETNATARVVNDVASPIVAGTMPADAERCLFCFIFFVVVASSSFFLSFLFHYIIIITR